MKISFASLLLLLTPALATAEPSVSTDTGRQIEQSGSEKITRDKKMGVDKSSGNRATKSKSRELAKEKAQEERESTKQSQESRAGQDFSTEVDINSLMIQGFTRHYEMINENSFAVSTPESIKYFATCKPFMYVDRAYPIIVQLGGVIGPKSNVTNWRVGGQGRFPADPNNSYISDYAQCRIAAHFWLTAAAQKVAAAPVTSESVIEDRLEAVFSKMDQDPQAFLKIKQSTRDLWQMAICTNWLVTDPAEPPHFDCGVFSYHGDDKFTVNRRPTLSAEAINGRKFKIAINTSESASHVAEQGNDTTRRSSVADRRTANAEVFSENKREQGMTISKSSEAGNQSKTNRGSGSSMNATPGSGGK